MSGELGITELCTHFPDSLQGRNIQWRWKFHYCCSLPTYTRDILWFQLIQDNHCRTGTTNTLNHKIEPSDLERRCFPILTVTTAAAAAKSLQSCPTLCDPIDGSPPGSAVPGILQARTLEWVAISFSNSHHRKREKQYSEEASRKAEILTESQEDWDDAVLTLWIGQQVRTVSRFALIPATLLWTC